MSDTNIALSQISKLQINDSNPWRTTLSGGCDSQDIDSEIINTETAVNPSSV